MVTTAIRKSDGSYAVTQPKSHSQASQSCDAIIAPVRKSWDAFEGSLRKSLERAIELGRALIAAKEVLPHGQFGRLFSDSKDPVSGHLPFRSQWAIRLMRMAENPVISNPHHGGDLPADLNTIYELSLMTAPALERAIEEGKVTPHTTRDEAKALRRGDDDPAPKKPRERSLESIELQLSDQFTKWRAWLSKFLSENPKKAALVRSFIKTLNQVAEGE